MDITILDYCMGRVDTITEVPEMESEAVEDYLSEIGYRLSDCYWIATESGTPYRSVYRFNGLDKDPTEI